MVSKATKIRLGVFLLIGGILILIFAAAVAGNKLTQKWDEYYIEFDNYPVSGLQVGGAVNYQGIKVGRVKEIKIDPNDVRKVNITIQIEVGTPIKEDTEAVLAMLGITGLKAVEIRGGTNEARNLKPKSYIKSGSTMIDDISERAVSIADKLEMIADNIHQLTNQENRDNISKILQETGLILQETRVHLSGTMEAMNRVANNTADLTDELTQNIDKVVLNFTGNIDSLSQTAITSLKDISSSLNSELTQITKNLSHSLDEIAEQGNLLLRDTRFHMNNIGSSTTTLVEESSGAISRISSSINSSLDRINAIIASDEFSSIVSNLEVLSGQLAEANMNELVNDMTITIKRAGTLINNLNLTVQRSRDDLMETLENLRDTTENLNEFSRQISDNPATLLRGN